ncbi:hypothetical protein BKA82DRAFT_34262 [Pisolithus tinctorius]|nr:hypothetical protein BKA82DRAFT_34262 [Pisolithus tinctorius]
MLLLTESTLHWLNLLWNISAPNRKALLLGRINKWANDVGPSSSNNSPQNSVPSDSHSNLTPHLPSSTVPSLTTNATSVSSAASDTILVYGRTPLINPSGLPTHDESGDDDKDQQGTVPVRFAGYCKTKLVACTANARFNLELEESNDDFNRPISNMALAGSKRKHTDHSSEYIVTSEVDEADDDGHHDRNIHRCTPKAPELRCVTAMSNIVIDRPVKKAKTSNNFSEQGVNTVGLSSSAGPGTPSQVSSSGTSGTRCIRYINLDLPATLQADRKWTKQILPALVMWAGSLADPWLIPDQDLMCLTYVFLDRQLISLRSNFGSTTIAIIAHFLVAGPSNDIDAESMDLPTIRETYNDLLERFLFLYQDLNHQNPTNTFRSQFILQLLAHTHLRSCIGCPDILALRTDTLKVFGVQGALALSCAALEHAIQLFQRGDMDVNNQISTWGKATAKTPLKLNRTSGKESSAALAFSEQNWECVPGTIIQ